MRAGIRYAKLVFLHLVGSTGHIVHFGASGSEMSTLFFMLEWGLNGFHKKHAGTRYAEHLFLHPVVYAGHVMHSGAFVV
jgi:hypothetical protein